MFKIVLKVPCYLLFCVNSEHKKLYNNSAQVNTIELAKKMVKSITESAFKKEVGRLDKRLAQVLDRLKEINGELKSTTKNTGQMVKVQKQMIETQKQLIASMKTVAARQAKKPRKLSEMNIFVREQIRSGKTFAEAIRAWREYKASKAAPAEAKPVSGPTEAQPQTTTETQQPPL